MGALDNRNKVLKVYSGFINRNMYSQDVNKRECALKAYKDGYYYSDCSSSVRLAYKGADIGFNNIGGNTVAQILNSNLEDIELDLIDGVPTDAMIKRLRVGDLLYYAGNDSSRKYAKYVGHVNMISSIKNDNTNFSLYDHGSGLAKTYENGKAYCVNRFYTKSSTPLGNKGLVAVKRVIRDAVEAGWKQDDIGWWYVQSDGSYPKSSWLQVNGVWYYFNEDGYMYHDQWLLYKDIWYYLKSDGSMARRELLKIENEYFAFNDDGALDDTDILKVNERGAVVVK